MCTTWDYTRAHILETCSLLALTVSTLNQSKSASPLSGTTDILLAFMSSPTCLHLLSVSAFSSHCFLRRSSSIADPSGGKTARTRTQSSVTQTRRYLKLLGQKKVRVSRSIIKEPNASARQFVLQVLTDERILKWDSKTQVSSVTCNASATRMLTASPWFLGAK